MMITKDRIVAGKTNKTKEYTVIPLSTARFESNGSFSETPIKGAVILSEVFLYTEIKNPRCAQRKGKYIHESPTEGNPAKPHR